MNDKKKSQDNNWVKKSINVKPVNYKNRQGVMVYKQFSLRHVFRGGAVIWIKNKGKDYYVVFRSLSRPNRGIQLPGGRVEKRENLADTIIREVYEETGIQCRIICPLGYIYFENPSDNYSNMQTYYIVKPIFPIDVTKKWRFIDKDSTKQTLEVWCVDVGMEPKFLSVGQDTIIYMFRQWLKDHKKDYVSLPSKDRKVLDAPKDSVTDNSDNSTNSSNPIVSIGTTNPDKNKE